MLRRTRSVLESVTLGGYFALYCAITLTTVLRYHGPWRDEAYVWLLARDLSYPLMFAELKYNGCPGLWHSLVVVLARLGLPYVSQAILHWAIASAAAGLILLVSPFSLPVRLMYCSTYYMAYEHAVIVRPYALSVLLLFSVAKAYPDRLRHPIAYASLIALAANSTALGLFCAGMMGAEFLWAMLRERKVGWPGAFAVVIALGGGALSAWSIRPVPDAFEYYTRHFAFFRPEQALAALCSGFTSPAFLESPPLVIIGALIGVFAFASVVAFLFRGKCHFPLVLLVSNWAWILYIVVFKYLWPSPRHASFLVVVLMLSLWLAFWSATEVPRWLDRMVFAGLVIAFSLGIHGTAGALREEVAGMPFSGSWDMARFISATGIQTCQIVGHRSRIVAAVLPYFRKLRLWYPETKAWGTFIHFDRHSRDPLSQDEVLRRVAGQFAKTQEVYFLSDTPLPPGHHLLHSSPGRLERMFLYRFNLKGAGVQTNGCHGRRIGECETRSMDSLGRGKAVNDASGEADGCSGG